MDYGENHGGFDDILANSPQPQKTSASRMSPEDFAAKKKAQREAIYSMVEQTTKAVSTNVQQFQAYLDLQARLENYSVNNGLLILAQCPGATQLRDFDGWRLKGAMVKRGQRGISILEPGRQYTTADGRIGTYYEVKSVFDITQTNAAVAERSPVYDNRTMTAALIARRPVPIELVDRLSAGAIYDSANKKIVVQRGMDFNSMFCCVSGALAKAEIHFHGGNPDSPSASFRSYCASYMMCKKYGLDVIRYNFSALPDFMSADTKEVRGELNRLHDVFKTMAVRMDRSLNQPHRSAPNQEAR